jgi:hypothetical protein
MQFFYLKRFLYYSVSTNDGSVRKTVEFCLITMINLEKLRSNFPFQKYFPFPFRPIQLR